MKTAKRLRLGTALLAGSVAATAMAAAATAEDLKIGAITSFSGSGQSLGPVYRTGWQLAVDAINAEGGFVGRNGVLVTGDTASDPTHGVSELRRLIASEKIEAILGSIVSQEVVPMVPLATEANLVQISAAASTSLTPEYGPLHFSTSPTGVDQMKANVDFAVDQLGLQKLALISDNGGMSKAAVAEIEAYMKERGVAPVIVQEFAFKAEDMTPQLFSMRSAGADGVLIINSIGDDARKFLENRLDIDWMVPVLGSMTMSNYAVGNALALGDEAFENVYSSQFVGMTYCPGDPLGESAFAKMREVAIEKVPDLDRMGGAESLVSAYMMAELLAIGINGAGTTDGKAVAKWFEAAGELQTVAGPVEATDSKHFFPNESSVVVITKPYEKREDGLSQRADCS
ncbi:ABC transporter substrate-binding protein [Paracoccus yeei]|uniref:ABC transporter substrate-binding protein n=1 Tax=Paracoccus yeei TaxID=147645 RepID=A0A5P2QTP6_9RHOB|nr:ABC transporter substrate-binding protein [Paracoccus yeei]QEU09458.1 ABC transporter substrate-binding protein [Paracoccus yeei]